MTDMMTAVISRGLVCDWLNEKPPGMGGFWIQKYKKVSSKS